MANHDDWRQRVGGVIQLLVSMVYADWTLALSVSAKEEDLNYFIFAKFPVSLIKI
jgi:hypothetical protein